ncbi:hypothetical protein ACFY78_36580 [Streptomyces olindensis]|uniref:hypothetical protein n=1 Tax=Streptomyces olindensis TaxID=358823 RepID=UPI0036B913F4
MSAYSRAYRALTRGRSLRPDEAAALLAQLRKETGEELAAAIEQELDGQFRRNDTDTDAEFRRKRRKYGAAMRTVNRFRELAASPLRTSMPHQRTRSTS